MGWQDSPIVGEAGQAPKQPRWASSAPVQVAAVRSQRASTTPATGEPRITVPEQEPSFAERNVAPVLDFLQKSAMKGGEMLPSGVKDVAQMVLTDARNNPVTQGLADPGIGIAQLAANVMGQGDKFNPMVQANEAEYQASRGEDAGSFDPARLAVNVLNPLALKGMSKVAPAATAGGRVWQGAGMSGAMAAAQPVTGTEEPFFQQKGLQALLASLFGGAVPVAAEVGKLGMRAIDKVPIGVDRTLRNYLDDLIGKPNIPNVVAAARGAPEYVPGSAPTVGEAVSSIPEATGLAAHQSAVSRIPKDNISGAFAGRRTAQQGARRSAIESVARTPAERASAEAQRTAIADPLYAAVRGGDQAVDLAPIAAQVDDLLVRNSGNPEMVSALSRVRASMMDGDELLSNPERVMSVLDGLKAAKANPENAFIGGTLDDLSAQLRSAIPGMSQADDAFRQASVPINRMDVGSLLRDKLISPSGVRERAGVYAGALRDAPRTIKNATDLRGFDELGDILTPEQVQLVTGIGDDLSRTAQLEDLVKQTNMGGMASVAEPTQIPNPLNPTITYANRILSFLQRGLNDRINRRASDLYLNPQSFADFLAQGAAPNPITTSISELMRRAGTAPRNLSVAVPAVASGQGVNY